MPQAPQFPSVSRRRSTNNSPSISEALSIAQIDQNKMIKSSPNELVDAVYQQVRENTLATLYENYTQRIQGDALSYDDWYKAAFPQNIDNIQDEKEKSEALNRIQIFEDQVDRLTAKTLADMSENSDLAYRISVYNSAVAYQSTASAEPVELHQWVRDTAPNNWNEPQTSSIASLIGRIIPFIQSNNIPDQNGDAIPILNDEKCLLLIYWKTIYRYVPIANQYIRAILQLNPGHPNRKTKERLLGILTYNAINLSAREFERRVKENTAWLTEEELQKQQTIIDKSDDDQTQDLEDSDDEFIDLDDVEDTTPVADLYQAEAVVRNDEVIYTIHAGSQTAANRLERILSENGIKVHLTINETDDDED